ncbi:MAG TPA: general stress protein [Planctomycetaceae bacterium]|nr:general stress protein [Planctomycetaceae bacterium]
MATTTASDTVIGVFKSQQEAQRAIADLRKQGYTEDQIGVISQHSDGTTTSDSGTSVEEGAVAGAATGAGLGALWGLGILSNVLPGIGPAIFGGTLGILLSSAAAGAAAAGIGGALVGMGIPDDDAKYYEGEVKAGRTIVTVHGTPKASQAQSVFTQYGGYNRATARR